MILSDILITNSLLQHDFELIGFTSKVANYCITNITLPQNLPQRARNCDKNCIKKKQSLRRANNYQSPKMFKQNSFVIFVRFRMSKYSTKIFAHSRLFQSVFNKNIYFIGICKKKFEHSKSSLNLPFSTIYLRCSCGIKRCSNY